MIGRIRVEERKVDAGVNLPRLSEWLCDDGRLLRLIRLQNASQAASLFEGPLTLKKNVPD